MSGLAVPAPQQFASGPTGALVPKVEDDEDEEAKEEVKEESPEVDIVINNVVCSFSVRCHLNLKEIALNGSNVEYRRENGMVTMKLR
jgi:transcription initiation factor TFIID TATA-box-binding protein